MAPKKSVTNAELKKMVEELTERVEALETRAHRKIHQPSINKVEGFNGEQEPEGRPTDGLKMGRADMIVSMRNAIKILNPKLVGPDGRHNLHNVTAVCGFRGLERTHLDDLESMLEEAYANL